MNGAAIRLRVKHATATLFAVAALAISGVFVIYAFLLATRVGFFGSAGREARQFLGHLLPLVQFAGGALVAGGAIALVNAIVAPRPRWSAWIAAAALAGGLSAALVPRLGQSLANVAMPLFAMAREVGKLPQREKERRLAAAARDEERWRAGVFAVTQDEVAEATGGTYRTTVASAVDLNGIPVRYVVAVTGDKTVYAILDVRRSGARVEFALACLRPLDPGPHNPLEDPCKP